MKNNFIKLIWLMTVFLLSCLTVDAETVMRSDEIKIESEIVSSEDLLKLRPVGKNEANFRFPNGLGIFTANYNKGNMYAAAKDRDPEWGVFFNIENGPRVHVSLGRLRPGMIDSIELMKTWGELEKSKLITGPTGRPRILLFPDGRVLDKIAAFGGVFDGDSEQLGSFDGTSLSDGETSPLSLGQIRTPRKLLKYEIQFDKFRIGYQTLITVIGQVKTEESIVLCKTFAYILAQFEGLPGSSKLGINSNGFRLLNPEEPKNELCNNAPNSPVTLKGEAQ